MFVTIALVTIAIFSCAYGYQRANIKGTQNGGWYGLVILFLLLGGLWAAGNAGNETLAYIFGFALIAAAPTLLIIGIASAIGRSIGLRKSRAKSS